MSILLLVFFPMVAALVLPFIRHFGEKALNFTVIGTSLMCLALSWYVLVFNAGIEISGFAGLGVGFVSGSLRSLIAVLAAFMWLMTALVSPEYFANDSMKTRYYVFYLWTLGSLMGVFYARDLFTLFIFFEIMSFTSYVWVAQNETAEALRASETYLYIAVIGGLTMLTGLFLLYFNCGTLDILSLPAAAADMDGRLRLITGICLLVGFGAKAGMFPLHIWLPKAHPVAPAPASALLSGMLTKSGVFGLIAVSCQLFEGIALWSEMLLILALVTMLLGAVLAVFSTDLKRTLACSSMSQIGFILTGLAMTGILGRHGSIAAYGTALHIINHSLIKLTLFVAAGVVYLNLHSLELNSLRGFGRGKPVLMLSFLSGACSIAGIPGFGGYISKTLLHESIVEHIHHLQQHGHSALPYQAAEWVFLISGGLTFAYMARLFWIIFIAPPAEGQHVGKERCMGRATVFVLGFAGLLMPLLGSFPHESMDKIAAFAVPFFRQAPMDHAVHYFAWVNLKGALISIGIGCAVFLLAGRLWLTEGHGKEEKYRQLWPQKLDLEDGLYRPLLRLLSALGTILARAVESMAELGAWLAVKLMFAGTGERIVPTEDENFSAYGIRKKAHPIQQQLDTDLFAVGIGITAFLILLFTVYFG